MTPSGARIVAPLPAGIVGGYGANLRRFCLVLHAQGQVTTERLTAILNGMGVEISKRQVVRLLTANLDTFLEEDRQVLRAGCNDLGGTLMNENISRAAGAEHGQGVEEEDLAEVVAPLGRPLEQRTTVYGRVRTVGRRLPAAPTPVTIGPRG